MITVKAAVENYGIGRYSLLRLVYRGIVKAIKQADAFWLIDEESLKKHLSLVPLSKVAGTGKGRTRAYYYLDRLPQSEVRVIGGRHYLTQKGAKALESLLGRNEDEQRD